MKSKDLQKFVLSKYEVGQAPKKDFSEFKRCDELPNSQTMV